MNTDKHGLKNQKSELRRQITAKLKEISPAVRIAESIELCARLEAQLRSAHTILFFAPMQDELDVWLLMQKFLEAKKICALPFFNSSTQHYSARRVCDLENDVAVGKFNIREPNSDCEEMALDRFDLVLVPGLAFDENGDRLGRGHGFYDRILANASGVKCGVAYDFQLVENIPVEPHDAKVNFIVTPKRCAKVG
ncbi:MAG TPA: 5-formyltetrahydrofolate cyclo-ligase [Candidatus Baltobacteraceae bacterium]|nr:5-formyltetrahydrofolate cyclo-ligase [Candidatus Baltobacteraceae bacterium]